MCKAGMVFRHCADFTSFPDLMKVGEGGWRKRNYTKLQICETRIILVMFVRHAQHKLFFKGDHFLVSLQVCCYFEKAISRKGESVDYLSLGELQLDMVPRDILQTQVYYESSPCCHMIFVVSDDKMSPLVSQ